MGWFKASEVKVLPAAMEALASGFAQKPVFDEVRKRVKKLIADNPDSARKALAS